jgi:hypothetical protein
MKRRLVASFAIAATATLTIAFTAWEASAHAHRVPTVRIERATVDRTTNTVDLRLRVCFSAGPRAHITISERRSYRGTVATHRWVPDAEKPARVSPYACRTGWRLNWLLEPRLQGAGAYRATIRVRDAYGRWSFPAAVSLT